MADRRKTGKQKHVKRTWGKPPLRPSAVVAGEVRGELRVIEPDTGKRSKSGHRMALVEDMKTGKRKEVRADNLLNGNTVSLGRIKKERYNEYMAAHNAALYMDLDGIHAGTMAAALATVGVDALTGKPIEKAEPKKLALPIAVKPKSVKLETKPEEPPKPEDKLRVLIPYLDSAQHGFITFGRVPNNLRQIDGNNIRELLVTAGIIDAKLNLTDNGKAWLQQR